MADKYEYKRIEIRKVYKGLEKFTPIEDREKNKEILEKYITKYLKEAQERRVRPVINAFRALDNANNALLYYRGLLKKNTKTRKHQSTYCIEGTIVESKILEDKLKDAIDST